MLLLLNIAGLMACFIGVLFTLPVTYSAIMYAYEDIINQRSAAFGQFGFKPTPGPQPVATPR